MATVIHLSAVLKSDFPIDVSKNARYLSCSAVVIGRRNSRCPYLLRKVSAQAWFGELVEHGRIVASGVPTSAVPSATPVSRIAPASCAPTWADPSLSNPCAEIVLAGSDAVHIPFTSGKTSDSVFVNSVGVSRRRNGRPIDGPEQASWKFGFDDPAAPAVPVPAPEPAVPVPPADPLVLPMPPEPGPELPPVPVPTWPAPAHPAAAASASPAIVRREVTSAPPAPHPSYRGRWRSPPPSLSRSSDTGPPPVD